MEKKTVLAVNDKFARKINRIAKTGKFVKINSLEELWK